MDLRRSICCPSFTSLVFACLLGGCTGSEETRRIAPRTVTAPLLPGGALESVSSNDSGVIAVGRDSAGHGAILVSTDGKTWGHITVAANASLPPLIATSWWRNGVIAFGTNREPSVWTSTDSRNWRRTAMSSTPFADAGVTDVVQGGPGLVAVGSREDPGETTEPVGGLIWTSTDGIAWRRTGDDKMFDLNEGNMTAVTRGGPGFVVAGVDIDGSVLWTSTDGLRWRRLPRDSTFRAAGITALTEFEGVLLALGARFPDNAPLVWRSSDAHRWRRETGGHSFGLTSGIADVTQFGSVLVAVGRDSTGGAIWTSADGLSWAAVVAR